MEKIVFDYSKLKGRIVEKCGSQKAFADRMNMSEATMCSKISCNTYFSQGEIARAIEILEIEQGRVTAYFFTTKV